MSCAQFFCKFFQELSYILVAIIFAILILPLLCLLGVPIIIFRWLLAAYCKKFRPDLGRILTPNDTVLAVDDMYGKPRGTCIVVLSIDGEITYDEVYKSFSQNVLGAKNEKGEICYPELRQYVHPLCGYFFWKKDPSFSLSNHIHEFDNSRLIAEEDLGELCSNLISQPLNKGRSPWDVYIVHNYKPLGSDSLISLLMFRFHHSLADGFSVMELIERALEPTEPFKLKNFTPIRKKEGFLAQIFRGIGLILITPYKMAQQSIKNMDNNDWLIENVNSEYNSHVLPKIPMTIFKEVKDIHKAAQLSSVIFAAFTGALREGMIKCGVKVPKNIHCGLPAPIPNHPKNKLANHMGPLFVELPIGEADPVKRLKIIDKHFKELKSDPYPYIAFHFIVPLFCRYPSFIIRLLLANKLTTTAASSFPGPYEQFDFKGRKVIDVNFGCGMLPGTVGIGMATLSYAGYMRVTIGFDTKILPLDSKPSVEDIAQGFMKEIEILKGSSEKV